MEHVEVDALARIGSAVHRDRDVDETEADGAIPDRPHELMLTRVKNERMGGGRSDKERPLEM